MLCIGSGSVKANLIAALAVDAAVQHVDRMPIARAIAEGLDFVTNDGHISAYPRRALF